MFPDFDVFEDHTGLHEREAVKFSVKGHVRSKLTKWNKVFQCTTLG